MGKQSFDQPIWFFTGRMGCWNACLSVMLHWICFYYELL